MTSRKWTAHALGVIALVVAMDTAACTGTISGRGTKPGKLKDNGQGVDGEDGGVGEDGQVSTEPAPPSGRGWEHFIANVQPALVEQCGDCHLGQRFAFASIERAGDAFTEAESLANYRAMFPMLSLDSPTQSRLLAKVVDDDRQMPHGGGVQVEVDDGVYETLLTWATLEQASSCDGCGQRAERAYVGYIDHPSISWASRREPGRLDRGLRRDASIMLQPINPATMALVGDPVDFLPDSFCGSDGMCDFGRMSANYAGDQLVFECRLAPGQSVNWLDLSWNICIAEIDPETGEAVDPRFVRPEADQHRGWSVARHNPFGLRDDDGLPLFGIYDEHLSMRKKNDMMPVFSPDDARIYLSSRGADPRTGEAGTRAYHGFEHTNNIISLRLDGTNPRTIYLNEGGTAEVPTFLRNGNLAVHVWNLERLDRHMYIQMTAEGMMEVPVLFGHIQGRNMWGTLTQLANGGLLGMTGHRRGSISHFVPFYADHTLGTGLDPEFSEAPFHVLDEEILAEHDESFAFCDTPPDGRNCWSSRFYDDPSYSPDGRALITYNPTRTQYGQDDSADIFWSLYGGSEEAISPHVPELQVALIDMHGTTETLITPKSGRALRYPTWVGKRQRPALQPSYTDESVDSAEIHIADFRLWLSFDIDNNATNKTGDVAKLDDIVAVRVLTKHLVGNACMNDGHPYRNAVHSGVHDHPTHLGTNNATGYEQYVIPVDMGGNANGHAPLESDGSVKLRVPAGRLLLFQGVDSSGHMVRQHERVFAMPPGHHIDTSVRREQYMSQCASCHGAIDSKPFLGLSAFDRQPAVMDFDTAASRKDPVDLTGPGVEAQKLTFLHRLRPLLDRQCVSCHSGDSPPAGLTLESEYSSTANFPKGRWASQMPDGYEAIVPSGERVEGYNWSPVRSFIFERDDYLDAFVDPSDPYRPLGELAPWDPGYQSLYQVEGQRHYYLTEYEYQSHVGRGGAFSKTSFLLEVLTGRDMDSRRDFSGPDHTGYVTEAEVRMIMALIDNGFPYMARCDDRTVPSGPNAGEPWGDPVETNLR